MKTIFSFYLIFMLFVGCRENPPVGVDGGAEIQIFSVWDSVRQDQSTVSSPMKNAKAILTSEYGTFVKTTDENGVLILSGLPSSLYNISIRMPHPSDPSILLVGSLRDVPVISGSKFSDTILAKPISSFGIAVNEVYACGPVNNIFFFFDQFIELYNSSDSVKYLDGMQVMRVSGNSAGKGAGADEDDDGDIDGITYIFKFPGLPGQKNYPFNPKTFQVLASDGINHKSTLANSVDLSNADWEFYNQFSANDIDNPSVNNLINIRSDRTVDFLIGLNDDIIVIASGIDSIWIDGIDISTIIDGFEYQSSPTLMKTLDNRIDRGFALSPGKYSGQSMQRRDSGGDTNDSSLDWEIIPNPTPGYFK
ncbi:MAG: DUF4876 domain-containing protein [Ignavibacteriaceae bacterium]|nr:DUF4876 domain-containing protein [Ignavibacteriaceae bacterium]